MEELNIGGQMVPNEANESIADIPKNKTLLVEQLTDEPPLAPDIVSGLKTVKDVFNYFQPNKEVEFEKEDGSTESEKLSFRGLEDFGKKGITNQSELLKELSQQYEDLQKFVTRLKQNKALKPVLDNPETKEAYMAIIKNLIDKLEAGA